MTTSVQLEAAKHMVETTASALERGEAGVAEARALRTVSVLLASLIGAVVAGEEALVELARLRAAATRRKRASRDKAGAVTPPVTGQPPASAQPPPPSRDKQRESHGTNPGSVTGQVTGQPASGPLSALSPADQDPPSTHSSKHLRDLKGGSESARVKPPVSRDAKAVSRETVKALIGAVDPMGGATLSPTDRVTVEELSPGLVQLAAERGTDAVTMLRAARARWDADTNVRQKHLPTSVFLSQIVTWIVPDDSRAATREEHQRDYEEHGDDSADLEAEAAELAAQERRLSAGGPT